MVLETTVLLDGLGFPEGPRWHDGKLWFSDMRTNQVMTVDLDCNACSDPMKLDTFGADFSEHQEVVHAHAAIVPRTRPE